MKSGSIQNINKKRVLVQKKRGSGPLGREKGGVK